MGRRPSDVRCLVWGVLMRNFYTIGHSSHTSADHGIGGHGNLLSHIAAQHYLGPAVRFCTSLFTVNIFRFTIA
jgi:hypothetical protein